MPTIVEFSPNPLRSSAIDRFSRPLRFAVYVLALGLALASLIFGPKPVLTGEAKIGSLPALGCTD
jgi:hypothetical protein